MLDDLAKTRHESQTFPVTERIHTFHQLAFFFLFSFHLLNVYWVFDPLQAYVPSSSVLLSLSLRRIFVRPAQSQNGKFACSASPFTASTTGYPAPDSEKLFYFWQPRRVFKVSPYSKEDSQAAHAFIFSLWWWYLYTLYKIGHLLYTYFNSIVISLRPSNREHWLSLLEIFLKTEKEISGKR